MGARILIVDDEPNIQRVVRACLVQAGYSVEQAGEGATASESILATDIKPNQSPEPAGPA